MARCRANDLILKDADRGADEVARIVEAMDQPSEALAYWYLKAVLHACHGSVSETARRVGMHRRTVQRILSGKPQRRRVVPEIYIAREAAE